MWRLFFIHIFYLACEYVLVVVVQIVILSVISDGGLCVRVTYLPGQSPAKYCRHK